MDDRVTATLSRRSGRRYYRFEAARLHETIAHDGIGKILTCRVEAHGVIGAANFIDITVMPPGTSIGLHTHGPADEEIYVVISGNGRMRLDAEEFAVGPGDVIVNSRCGTHGLINIGSKELRLVVVELHAEKLDTECHR